MIKKIVALGLVVLGAFIILPFGFGLWNDNIEVHGEITIAGIESITPSDSETIEETPSESVCDEPQISSDSSVATDNEAIKESESPKLPSTGNDEGLISSTDSSKVEKTDTPLPLNPVEAVDSESCSEQAQP